MRRLWSVQERPERRAASGTSVAPMQAVVEKLTVDDMLAIAVYTAWLAP